MKKFTTLATLAVAGLSMLLSACGPQTYEIALVTDIGDIDDKSFNQGAWEGVVEFAEENNKTHQYYKPTAVDNTEYVNTIDLAIEGGAKVVVTPGFLFETPIFLAQDQHPDVSFILLDGVPHSADYSEFRQEDNVLSILYAEQQAGYLAGYAAVADGYRSLGFMGGMAVPAVVKFGVGFMLGAQSAATDENVEVTIQYHYTGDFADTPDNAATAETMFDAGVEVIFAAGGAVGLSVMSEAEKADKDYDKDGKIEKPEEEYKGVKDRAIKKATSSKLKEADQDTTPSIADLEKIANDTSKTPKERDQAREKMYALKRAQQKKK